MVLSRAEDQPAELERSFARLHEARRVIAVSNGTMALVAALRAHGIGPGDEVITAPLTFVATLNAILEVGAIARFADVTGDLTLDPAAPAGRIGCVQLGRPQPQRHPAVRRPGRAARPDPRPGRACRPTAAVTPRCCPPAWPGCAA